MKIKLKLAFSFVAFSLYKLYSTCHNYAKSFLRQFFLLFLNANVIYLDKSLFKKQNRHFLWFRIFIQKYISLTWLTFLLIILLPRPIFKVFIIFSFKILSWYVRRWMSNCWAKDFFNLELIFWSLKAISFYGLTGIWNKKHLRVFAISEASSLIVAKSFLLKWMIQNWLAKM